MEGGGKGEDDDEEEEGDTNNVGVIDDGMVLLRDVENDTYVQSLLDDHIREKNDEVFIFGTTEKRKGGSGFRALVNGKMVGGEDLERELALKHLHSTLRRWSHQAPFRALITWHAACAAHARQQPWNKPSPHRHRWAKALRQSNTPTPFSGSPAPAAEPSNERPPTPQRDSREAPSQASKEEPAPSEAPRVAR